MSRRTITTIYDDAKKRRIVVYERDDGGFGFHEDYFSEVPSEMAWLPLPTGYGCICDTLEILMREMRGRVAWIAEVRNLSS
jgi:hypothetical protein